MRSDQRRSGGTRAESEASAGGALPDPPDREYLLVTEYFHPEEATTGTLLTDLAVGLRRRGLDVSVLTAQPHYHSGDAGRQPRRSVHEGVPVRRVRAPQVRQSSLARRLFNWSVFTAWVALVLLFDRTDRPRELVFVSNPPFLPPVLPLVCRLRGWSYTYVVHDLYPDFLVASGTLGPRHAVTRVWAAFNRHTFGHARRVVALGPTMRERICRTTGANPDRVAVVHNWQDGEFVRPLDKSENPFSAEHGLDAAFSLLYSGNIGGNHDLATLVHGAAALRDAEDPVRVLVVGEGDERDAVVALAAELEAENVAFLPYQPRAVLPHSLTSADVSVVAVERGMEGVCVSSKLYTALAAGKPVLAIASHRDDVGRLVAEFDVGRVVRQGDVAGLVAAVREWQADPALLARQGVNARTAFEAHFTRDRSVDAYYRLLVEE